MTAAAYIENLLAIREARYLRDLRDVRRTLPPRDRDDPQSRFLREQLAERELELASALTV